MKDTVWDVIVVGGGPAGMMAAGRAAEKGARVLLLEKNESLGKKLLITGGGRCNVTNAETDTRKLLSKFKEAEQFLYSAFSQWSVGETLDFFHTRGIDTKVEPGLRVFPVSDSSSSVLHVLSEYLKSNKVTVRYNAHVTGIAQNENTITGVKLSHNELVQGNAVVIATGGTSRPDTGSTGDGYAWLKSLGHTIIKPEASLVPIALKDSWVKQLSGVSLENVKITILQNNVKQGVAKGKILFTHVGVSGPTILNMSKDVGELLKYGSVVLSLDLLPKEDYGTLNTALQNIFKEHDKKNLENALPHLIPSSMVPIVLKLSGIDPETKCHSVSRESRIALTQLLKAIPMNVEKLLGTDKAIVTSGGVTLSEVDFKTMRSRIYPNLYLVGDMLNIDRPSGGYSLQLCWTTGYVAGNSATTQ